MSKFCGVISEQPLRSLRDLQTSPLEFAHLDILSELLMNDTADLNEEYIRKVQFMHGQQQKLLQNEQQLNVIHSMMQHLLPHITILEMQVQENDMQLDQIQQRIRQMEDGCQSPGELMPSYSNEYGSLMMLIQRMDNMMMQLNILMAKLAECISCMQPRSNAFNMVYAVLDQHVRVLNQLERNLDGLIDKSRLVDEMLFSNQVAGQVAATCQQCIQNRQIPCAGSISSSNSSYC